MLTSATSPCYQSSLHQAQKLPGSTGQSGIRLITATRPSASTAPELALDGWLPLHAGIPCPPPPSWRWMGSFHCMLAFHFHRPQAGAGWAASASCWHSTSTTPELAWTLHFHLLRAQRFHFLTEWTLQWQWPHPAAIAHNHALLLPATSASTPPPSASRAAKPHIRLRRFGKVEAPAVATRCPRRPFRRRGNIGWGHAYASRFRVS